MKIAYAYSDTLISKSAPALQVAQNCAALARQSDVCLISGQWDRNDEDRRLTAREAIASHYGVELPASMRVLLTPPFRWMIGKAKIHANYLHHWACLIRILQENRPDVVLVRNLKLARFLLKAKRVLGLPPIVYEAHEVFAVTAQETAREVSADRKRKVMRLTELERYVCTHADGIISTTKHMAEVIADMYQVKTPIMVAPNGIDLSLCGKPEKHTRKDNANTIAYLGSLHEWKGIDVLVEAMKLLPNAHLRITGGKDDAVAKYKAMAEQMGVSDRVEFEGYVKPSLRFDRLSDANILVLPLTNYKMASHFTSPLKIFEYMAADRPIVTSDLPSIREILTNNVNAILVQPDDPKALAEGIRKVLENPELGRKIAEQAALDVKAYSWDERAVRVIEFVKSIINRQKPNVEEART